MFLFIFIGLFSLAAAQCGNSCNCGVTTCCQTAYSTGSPYSIFNLGNNQQYSYAQQYRSNQQDGSSARPDAARTACLKTNPIPHSQAQLYQNQPLFTRVLANNDDTRQIDNICTTLFPLPDDSSTYVIYNSNVYCDGSYSVSTSVSNDVGTGTTLIGNAFSSYFQRTFASVGNNIYIGCIQDVYGDSGQSSVFAISLGSVSPLGGSCVEQIQNIVQCVGQGQADGLYVLPYKQPTRCVTQQVCTLFNPLLYSNKNRKIATTYTVHRKMGAEMGDAEINLILFGIL